jgi:hypothetical protein
LDGRLVDQEARAMLKDRNALARASHLDVRKAVKSTRKRILKNAATGGVAARGG